LAVARAAIDAVDAGACVRVSLRARVPALFQGARCAVIAAGKAAAPMMRAALAELPTPPLAALCVAPAIDPDLPSSVSQVAGGHPVPTAGSIDGGERALALAASLDPADVLLVLLSGGASALLAVPAEGLTLDDKRATTQRLLRAGADIHALNAVRKHLSRIKGGRLAAATRARTTCLAISDVVGDDLSVIGSGPTVADPSTFDDALSMLDRFGGRGAFPPSVVACLERGALTGVGESPKPGAPALSGARTEVIAGRLDALTGARREAERLGYHTIVLDTPVTGEARTAAAAHEAFVRRATDDSSAPLCLLSAGETTVTVTGSGRGGRNQEFAVASLRWLDRLGRPAVLASVGTDGIDGPTDAAGALVDSTTLARALDTSPVAPEAALADNASYPYLDALGALVRTGPTGTNVGDVQIVILGAAS
jgi:hydroxypyruvate reductase